jgi:hypothetical protein
MGGTYRLHVHDSAYSPKLLLQFFYLVEDGTLAAPCEIAFKKCAVPS